MKPITRALALTSILATLFLTGACSGHRRMESANGKMEDLSGPVSPEQTAEVTPKAVAAREISADQEKALQGEVLSLPEGLLTFDVPPALRRNNPVRVEARLSRDFIVKLNEALAAQTKLSGIKVKDMMGLQLNAPGMSVKPLSSLEQWVGSDPTTTWAWEVNPSALGRHSMTLTLVLHLSNVSEGKQRAYPVLERFVDVQEPESGFFTTYGWWILALILVAVAVVLLVKKP
jgi:hypothetical protein